MTKKILNTDAIANELEGASLFFSKPAVIEEKGQKESKQVLVESTLPPPPKGKNLTTRTNQPKQVILHASKQANTPARMQANMLASKHTSSSEKDGEVVEIIRQSVKQLGKETVYLRMTTAEKRELTSVVITINELYQNQIRKTSENEVGRIAVAYLLTDYKENGELSILARVIKALNA